MTRRQRLAAVVAAAGAAVGVYLATGTMPAPAAAATTWRGMARVKCARARALAAVVAKVDCVGGERVYVRVEVNADVTVDTIDQVVRSRGLRLIRSTMRRRKTARYPSRVVTVLGNRGADRCLGGVVRRLTSEPPAAPKYWRPRRGWGICCGAGCECAGARCAPICSPHVYAGDTCDDRICRRWPGLEGCA